MNKTIRLVSRRLTPTTVYHIQNVLVPELRAKARKAKKRFDIGTAAKIIAGRFSLDLRRVNRIVGVV